MNIYALVFLILSGGWRRVRGRHRSGVVSVSHFSLSRWRRFFPKSHTLSLSLLLSSLSLRRTRRQI